MRPLRKRVDVDPIYDRCMEDSAGFRLTATQVSAAFGSPFTLYCRYHGDPVKMDPPDPFLQALSRKGIEHEADVLESDYPEMEKVSYETPEEGFMMALQSMAKGTKALSNLPLFYLPEGMHGYADVLEKQDGDSLWGNHHYAVREIKVARNLTDAHRLQAAFYTLMIGRIQQRVPERFSVTNGDGETFQYGYAEYEDLLVESIAQANRIRGGWMPPAVHGEGKAPWSNFCNEVAVQNNDPSIIPGVGASMRAKMIAAGFGSVKDVAASTPAALQQIKGMGKKTSVARLASAKAIATGRLVRKDGAIDLPERGTEIFLDLEGLNDVFDDTMSDYLIGALVRADGKEEYVPFIAEGKDEAGMLRGFMDFMEKQQDYVIYHWHHYEKTHLRMLMDQHGMDGRRFLEPDVMIDLSPVATNAFAFPTHGNSIKDVAKWLGFRWRQANVGATSSIGLYLEYAEDPDANRDKMQMVLDYNEDDCIATRVVKDWLATGSGELPATSQT